MLTRRTILERALSLTAGAAVATTITPAEAARLLAEPASAPVPQPTSTTLPPYGSKPRTTAVRLRR
jgi:hypothetical protein